MSSRRPAPRRLALTTRPHTKPARRARRSTPQACAAALRLRLPGWAPDRSRQQAPRSCAHRTAAGGSARGGVGRGGWRKRPLAEEGAIEFQTQTTARARPEPSRAERCPPRPPRPSGARTQTPWLLRSSRRGPPSRRGPREGRSAAAPQPPHAQTWARASRLGAEPGAPAAPPCRDPTGRRSTNAGTWCLRR